MVNFFLSSADDREARTLFVKNLSQKVTEKKLKKVFPNIEGARIPKKPDDTNRG